MGMNLIEKLGTKKVISFSGGRTSAYLVNLFKDDPEVHFVFMDTGAEHPATYQFIKDIVKNWKIDLVCLRTVVNPKKGIGCTYKTVDLDDLKQDLEPWKPMLAKYGAPYYHFPNHLNQILNLTNPTAYMAVFYCLKIGAHYVIQRHRCSYLHCKRRVAKCSACITCMAYVASKL